MVHFLGCRLNSKDLHFFGHGQADSKAKAVHSWAAFASVNHQATSRRSEKIHMHTWLCYINAKNTLLDSVLLLLFHWNNILQSAFHPSESACCIFFLHYFKCVANYMKQLNFMWQLCCLVKCLHLCSNTRMLALESYFSFFPNDSLNYDFCFHVELYQICFVCLVICVSYLGIMKSMCCNACSKS